MDTNIWLKHCGRIYKCVRNGVIKVLIPLIVFQELRALRKSPEATIADAATRSVIIIRELYLTREVVPLRFDGTVASDINETTEFENNSTWRSNVDETILHAVNEHDEMGKRLMKGLNLRLSSSTREDYKKRDPPVLNSRMAKTFKYCILITDDRNMRLRAKTIGLTYFKVNGYLVNWKLYFLIDVLIKKKKRRKTITVLWIEFTYTENTHTYKHIHIQKSNHIYIYIHKLFIMHLYTCV